MRPLVIGTGFLGKTVVGRLQQDCADVAYTHRSHQYFNGSFQFDLFAQTLSEVISLTDIDVVIMTTGMEPDPDMPAVDAAMRRLFHCCKNKRVIYVSTDAVFDGQKGRYGEDEIPHPATRYGRHKKVCEDMLARMVPDHCIVRTSYIYGYSLGILDSRLQAAVDTLNSGRTVRKYGDMFKSPTEVNQLAGILEKIARSEFNGILHVSGHRMSVYDFFRQALAALGHANDRLSRDWMPDMRPPEYLVDTSLDSGLSRKMFEFEPVTIEKGLVKSAVDTPIHPHRNLYAALST